MKKLQNIEESEISYESRLKDLYKNPVGHDIFAKLLLQLGKSEKLILNPIVGNLKIKALARLTRNIVGKDFFEAFIKLINSEKSLPAEKDGKLSKKWWKEAVFYQIYPRSFCDSNKDGIGDLRGVISKLDYLQELGVDAIWLSPVYDSPMDDNGYDIRDYHKILKDFGTLEDFDLLLKEVHKRNMKLIMDLVVNHTSDEHEWFQKALEDKNSIYHDFYIFRKKNNNWTSFFSGPAWNYYEKNKEWALHLFSKKQMDLNWENPKLRDHVISMINWWLEKGVDGFRMDVINYISKAEGLPDGNPFIGKLMGYTGIEHYFYGPHLHEYLKEINRRAFTPHQAFSVGETPGLGMQTCRLVTGSERRELDMVFSFDHLEAPGHTRFEDYEYDLNYFRDYMIDWQQNYGNNCWNSLFYNNHDNPKMASKIKKQSAYSRQIQKLLAVMQFTLRGTPFIFQGEEMGLLNYDFDSIDQINDVESRGLYAQLCKSLSPQQAFAIIQAGTREHARIPLPFDENFEAAEALKPFTKKLMEQQQVCEEIFYTYKKLIALRKSDEKLIYSSFELLLRKKNRFVYKRANYIVDCNLGEKEAAPYRIPKNYKVIFDTASAEDACSDNKKAPSKKLGPYQAIIYKNDNYIE